MKDCFVILGSKFVKLGDLAPGAEAQVELDLSSLGAPNFSSPLSYAMFDTQLNGNVPNDVRRQAEAKRSIIENLFERTTPFISSAKAPGAGSTGLSQAPMFVGWMEEAPPQVKIFGTEPAQKTTALVLTPLTYSLFNSSGTITLPPGLIPGQTDRDPARRRHLRRSRRYGGLYFARRGDFRVQSTRRSERAPGTELETGHLDR